jgi:GTP-binding protein HflX
MKTEKTGLLVFVECPPFSTSLDLLKREILEIAHSAGRNILSSVPCRVKNPFPRYYLGRGKVEEIRRLIEEQSLDFVLINVEITPSQQRNLEEVWGVPVYTKYALVHEIFAKRARTAQGKIKVELARLRYELSRLTGKGENLSRLGGGIGTRGPGEQKIEVERRKIKNRIASLTRELKRIEQQALTQRASRKRSGILQIAVVGYTNAGKSTLLNALTGARVYAEERMFATLDPTARRLFVPEVGETVIVDTVGFIREMPETIKEAFFSTLEEVREADLILEVLDVSDPDYSTHFKVVNETLGEIGAENRPKILVLNKVDLLEELPPLEYEIRTTYPYVFVSALKRTGLRELLEIISFALRPRVTEIHFEIPPEKLHSLRQQIRFRGYIKELRSLGDGKIALDCVIQRELLGRISSFVFS